MNAEETMGLIQGRRSVRRFKPDPVPREDIEKMVTAASWAPSGSNTQNWRFIAVSTPQVIQSMAKAVRDTIETMTAKISSPRAVKEFAAYSRYYAFFEGAPLVFAVVAKPYESIASRIYERYGLIKNYSSGSDLTGPSAAIQNLLLMAYSLGYGTCWMTGPMAAKEPLEIILGIQPPDNLIALVPVGRPDAMPKAPPRKPLADILTFK